MAFVDNILDRIGRLIARRLEKPASGRKTFPPPELDALRRTLRPADVLLVDGDQKISTAIKYLTQSTWSHAALYVGDVPGLAADGAEACCLIEANVGEGVVAAPLSKYTSYSTRICRPVGLSADEVDQVVCFAVERACGEWECELAPGCTSAASRKFALMFAAHAVANFRLKSCTRVNSLLVRLIRRKS